MGHIPIPPDHLGSCHCNSQQTENRSNLSLYFTLIVITNSYFSILQIEEPIAETMTSHIAMLLLFVVQMGEHSSNGPTIRVLSMTLAMLTFLMFMYYNCDITAEMTSGPPAIPVKNFEDVLHHGYRLTHNLQNPFQAQTQTTTFRQGQHIFTLLPEPACR